jgi:(2R)-sulfolactate sulfo-lyase subunit alpha
VRKFWVHAPKDSVGVAVSDIGEGESVSGVFMGTTKALKLKSVEVVQLGHKIALKDIAKGEKVVEYGEVIGEATKPIREGEHVHVHNLRSLRWRQK